MAVTDFQGVGESLFFRIFHFRLLTHVLPVMKAKHSEVTYECEKGEVWVGGCVHSADSTRYPRQQAPVRAI